MAEMRKRGIVTKKRLLKSGKIVGGIAFTRGPLAHLLQNRFYIGEVVFKGETLPGQQPAIIDRKLSDAVQAKLDGQFRSHKQSRTSSEALVTKSVRDQLDLSADLDDKVLVQNHVTRVDLRPDQLVIGLAALAGAKIKRRSRSRRLEVPWRKTSSPRRREILLPETPSPNPARPIRSENRALLIASIAKGRRWLNALLTEPAITIEAIAQREGCSVRKVNMTISFAFLAPTLSRRPLKTFALWDGCHSSSRTSSRVGRANITRSV